MPTKLLTLLAFIPLLIGLDTMLAWWVHLPILLQFSPNQIPVSFNSGLCSLLAGVALMMAIYPSDITQRIQVVVGFIILLLASLTLTEDLLGINLHIDELCVQCWLPDTFLHPGRMALNTSLSFFFFGLAQMAYPLAYRKWFAIVVEFSIFLVFLFGILGFTTYILRMEFLYGWYNYSRMAFLNSIGFIVSSIILWSIWRKNIWAVSLYEGQQDTKIILFNTAILLSVALTSALATFTKSLHLILTVTAIAVFVGLLFLRLQVVPLVRRVMDTEQELLRTNKRLRNSEERYNLAVTGSHAGLWDWVVGAEQVFSSPYLKAMLGYAEHEMPNTLEFYRKNIHPDDVDKVFDLVDQHLLKHVPFETEYRIKTKTGEYRWFLAVGQAIWDADGNATRMAGSLIDITERKNLESLKSEFISIVSHELRTPLTSIHGALGLLQGGNVGDFSEKAKSLIDMANNNCEHLMHLINDILDMEKIEAGKMNFHLKNVNIDQVVNEAIAANKLYADKFEVALHLMRTLPGVKVNVDPYRLIQVLTNLITNAVKFSPRGGDVGITVLQYEDRVRVSVIDKGKGVAEEFRSHIFEKFAQADSSTAIIKGGTGLGLSISKAIMEKLGGILDFSSKLGEGSTFYIDLPRSNILPEVGKNKKNTGIFPINQPKILICDDDEEQSKYLALLLKSSGYETDIANTATQAKALIAQNHYIVILLDLLLPDQDGIAFVRELRNAETTKTLPIIVLSVVAATGRSLLADDPTAVSDWLDKPVDFNKLIKDIESINKQVREEKPHILHVDDNVDAQQIIANLLLDYADITVADTLRKAEEILAKQKFDLVILDVVLPDGKGGMLLPLLAEKKIPVIVFSAVELDYELSKFVVRTLVKSKTSYQELLATIRSILETEH